MSHESKSLSCIITALHAAYYKIFLVMYAVIGWLNMRYNILLFFAGGLYGSMVAFAWLKMMNAWPSSCNNKFIAYLMHFKIFNISFSYPSRLYCKITWVSTVPIISWVKLIFLLVLRRISFDNNLFHLPLQ